MPVPYTLHIAEPGRPFAARSTLLLEYRNKLVLYPISVGGVAAQSRADEY
jgi:hypothetical protein